jgi:hypothetical protein
MDLARRPTLLGVYQLFYSTLQQRRLLFPFFDQGNSKLADLAIHSHSLRLQATDLICR